MADLIEAEKQIRSLNAEFHNLEVKFTENVNLAITAQTQLRDSIIYFRQEMKSEMSNLPGRIDQQTQLMVNLEVRLVLIESELARGSTWSARLRRHRKG